MAGAIAPVIEIRPATPADAEAMVELEHASAIHHAAIDPTRWRVPTREAVAGSRRRRAVVQPSGEALVAVVDGRVVGMIEVWLRLPPDPDSARTPTVRADLGISVAPDWRGRGVGTALMRAGEAWGRRHGASRMVLDLAVQNDAARRLYERLGYEVHGLLMDRVIGEEPGEAGTRETEELSLRGSLVRLRPLRPADRAELIRVLSDPTVAAWWDTRGPEVSADELIAGEPGFAAFAVEVDGELAGSIQYSEEEDGDYRHAGIDVFLDAAHQGRGLGTDAVRTLARYLLEVRRHHRLTIDPAASNARAIASYTKVGFKPVGVMREYERGPNGTYHDGLLMDLLAGELR